MKILNEATGDVSTSEPMIWLYGPPKVGKTTSILATAPKNILVLQFEQRTLQPAINASGIKKGEYVVAEYDSNWDDFMDFISGQQILDVIREHDVRCILPDSMTYLMSNVLGSEIEDETFNSGSKEYKNRKLVNSTRKGLDGYGALSSQMLRMAKALGKIARGDAANGVPGVPVIFTSHLQENPKYDTSIERGPALVGREFGKLLPGILDAMGMVEHRYVSTGKDKEGNEMLTLEYPPIVRFTGDGTFECAFTTGKPVNKMVCSLNVSKIIERIKMGGE